MKSTRLALLILAAGCQCPRERTASNAPPPAQLPSPNDPLNRRTGASAAVQPVELGSAQLLPPNLVNRRMPGLQFADEVDAGPANADARAAAGPPPPPSAAAAPAPAAPALGAPGAPGVGPR